MLFKNLGFIPRPSIALDLGTANTRVYSTLHDALTEIPSLVPLVPQKTDDHMDEYLQHANANLAVAPLRGGVIIDLKNTVKLLKPIIYRNRKFFLAPLALTSAPTDSTVRERNALRRALTAAGSSIVSIIPEAWAAALGAGIDPTRASAQLVVDIGDGVTDMAVFRNSRMVFNSSIRVACSDLHRVVRSAVVARYKIQILKKDTERLVGEVTSFLVGEAAADTSFEVAGYDIVNKRTTRCCIQRDDIIDSVVPVMDKIVNMIGSNLSRLPEPIYCDILESGILLTGGGACIKDFDRLIALKTDMDVRVGSDPMHAVINGEIETLRYWKEERDWWEMFSWPLNHVPRSIRLPQRTK